MKKIVIGITGKSGSGKTTIGKIFRKNGALFLDADKISARFLEKNKKARTEILENFGSKVLTKKGNISRKKLGRIVFTDFRKMKKLEEIVYNYIFDEIFLRTKKTRKKLVLIEAVNIFGSDLKKVCDEIWLISANRGVREERLEKAGQKNFQKRVLFQEKYFKENKIRKKANKVFDTSFYSLGKMKEIFEEVFKEICNEK